MKVRITGNKIYHKGRILKRGEILDITPKIADFWVKKNIAEKIDNPKRKIKKIKGE